MHTVMRKAGGRAVNFFRTCFLIVACALTWSSYAAAKPRPHLIVTRILHDGVSVRHTSSFELTRGQKLPADTEIGVPDRVTVLISSGKSTATLHPNSTTMFHWTGSVEQVIIMRGQVIVDDPLDFFHVRTHRIHAAKASKKM